MSKIKLFKALRLSQLWLSQYTFGKPISEVEKVGPSLVWFEVTDQL